MDTQRPHDILPTHELPKGRDRLRYVKLADDQHADLEGMTPEERHAWVKYNIPTKERLAIHLESLGHDYLAKRAREGLYSDFESKHETPKVLLMRDLKRNNLYKLAALVRQGEYDDTKAESDAWAKEQTGEVKQILDDIEKAVKEDEQRSDATE